MAAKEIFWNWIGEKIQISDSSASDVPQGFWNFYKFAQLPLAVAIIKPCEPYGPNDFTRLDISGMTLKASCFSTLNTSTPEAEQTAWTKDATPGVMTFTGSLDLNTTPFNNVVGSADSTAMKFQLELSDSTGVIGRYLRPVTVKQGTAIATASPDPLTRYMTFAEFQGLSAKLVNLAGETITLVSPDGTQKRILGVANDGSPIDDSQ